MKNRVIFKLFSTAIFCTITLLISFTACESGSEPEKYKSPEEYSWTADTLSYPGTIQTLMSSIWASGPDDVYICGHTDRGGKVYHYNGIKWNVINLIELGIAIGDKYTVFGFSPQDVWIGGADTRGTGQTGYYQTHTLAHYNGQIWKEYEFESIGAIRDVWGENPDDVWACGDNGIVIHYTDGAMIVDTIDAIEIPGGASFQSNSIRIIDGVVNVISPLVEQAGGYVTFYHFVKVNDEWSVKHKYVIDISGQQHKFGARSFYTYKSEIYSYGSDGIFKYEDEVWNHFYNVDVITGMAKYSSDNILAVSSSGDVHNYENGKWSLMNEMKKETLNYRRIWANGEEAFIVGYTMDMFPAVTVVLHGE